MKRNKKENHLANKKLKSKDSTIDEEPRTVKDPPKQDNITKSQSEKAIKELKKEKSKKKSSKKRKTRKSKSKKKHGWIGKTLITISLIIISLIVVQLTISSDNVIESSMDQL